MPDSDNALSNSLMHLRRRRRPVKVLLHLDDSLLSEIVRASLERLDQVELFQAIADEDATDLLRASTIDLVVLDGADDPVEALADIERFRAAGPDVRVIVLLADDDPQVITAFLDAGATSCVSKSVYPCDLGAVIRQAARGTVFHRPGRGYTPAPARDEDDAAADADNGHRPEALTPREREILVHVTEGAGNKEIARLLSVTEPTVKFHLSNIYRKLGVSNRTRASRIAERYNLLSWMPYVPLLVEL